MSKTVNGTFNAKVQAQYKNAVSAAEMIVGEQWSLKVRDVADPTAEPPVIGVDDIFSTQVPQTLLVGQTLVIDLYDLGGFDVGAGPGRDNLGTSELCDEVVALQITTERLDEDDETPLTGTLLVGGEGSGACWNSLFNGDDDAKLAMKPNSSIQFLTGYSSAWAVADSSNHLLKLEASGAKVRFKITCARRKVA